MTIITQFKKFEGHYIDEDINNFVLTYKDCDIEILNVDYQQSNKAVNKQVPETRSSGYGFKQVYVWKVVDEIAYSALVKYNIDLNKKEILDKKIEEDKKLLSLGVDPTINRINKGLKDDATEKEKYISNFLICNLIKGNLEFSNIIKREYRHDRFLNQYVSTN